MGAQMVPDGAAGGHFALNFADLQAAIEAIDKAIADQKNLPQTTASPRTRPAAATKGRAPPTS